MCTALFFKVLRSSRDVEIVMCFRKVCFDRAKDPFFPAFALKL